MALMSCRCRGVQFLSLLVVGFGLLASASVSAVMVPLEGEGNFPMTVDLVNRWSDENRLDVLVLVEVANSDLKFVREDRGLVGRLDLEVTLEGPGGQVLTKKHQIRTPPLDQEEARSRTLFQNFGAIFENVPFRSGRFTATVHDVNMFGGDRPSQMKMNLSRSRCGTLWFAPDGPRPDKGLALEDPLFLAHAPLDAWNPDRMGGPDDSGGWMHDYAHPSRRYGLEEDHLQIFVPVWPPSSGILPGHNPPNIRLQITNLDMDFVANDTIHIDSRGRLALAAGRPADIVYSLDVNILPPGPYRLSLAPLGGFGRGTIQEFSVVWDLSRLGRTHRHVEGEGRLVFSGGKLDHFLAGSSSEQEKMLDDFWAALDPDPTDDVNPVYLKFQYRLAYVQQFLGGFGEFGPYDERGEVFLLLGPPDELQTKKLPMNETDQDDARIKVFNRFAPDREGTWIKGGSQEGSSEARDPYKSLGGVPMPASPRAEKTRTTSRYTASHFFAFELWKYDHGGDPLFINRFSNRGMGQRFLFVDKSGTGEYYLESSNLIQGED